MKAYALQANGIFPWETTHIASLCASCADDAINNSFILLYREHELAIVVDLDTDGNDIGMRIGHVAKHYDFAYTYVIGRGVIYSDYTKDEQRWTLTYANLTIDQLLISDMGVLLFGPSLYVETPHFQQS